MTAIVIFSFFVLVLLGVPLCYSFASACGAYLLLASPGRISTLVSRMFNGANSFTLIALPMFILAGELMNRGGLTQRIVDFCLMITRPIRGGLGEVNVIASIVFGGITGSSVADTTAIGGIMIPAMEKAGYPTDYSAGVTVASSTIGMVIPPSIPMLVYAVISSESVGALFMSTAIPGLLIGILQTVVVYFQSEKRGFHPVYTDKMTMRQVWDVFRNSILAIIMPVLIILSIATGICTATESAALAVVYAAIVGGLFYHDLKLEDLIPSLKNTAVTTAGVMIIVACATVFTWVMAILQIPATVQNFITGLNMPVFLILLIFDFLILIIGTFLDVTPALLLLGPILIPIMQSFGIGKIQFGAIMIVGLAISLVTPPVALCLNACSKICGLKMGRIFHAALPLLMVNVLVFVLVTFVPAVSLWLPGVFGY